jgi:hypothetical protein
VDAVAQVEALYTAYQARDWVRAASYLHPDAVVEMPATGERLDGRDGVIEFQRSYPEPWGTLTVLRVLGDPRECAAEVEIVDPAGQRFVMAAFWRQAGGLLRDGVEYWVTVGGDRPPPGRPTSFAAPPG